MSIFSKLYKNIMPKKTAKKVKTPKKKIAKKVAPKKAKAQKKIKAPKPIGRVTHFFGNIEVAIVKFNKPVKVGAKVSFRGATTDFDETIKSMQFDHKPIAVAKKGKEIGIKVKGKVREGDEVFDVK